MKRTLALMALVTTLTAGSAFALPYNDRADFITPGSSSEPSLQSILNATVTGPGGTKYDARTSQSTAALWTITDKSSDTFLVSLNTAHAAGGALGIYSPNGKEYDLLSLGDGTSATFTIANGNLYGAGNKKLVTGFGNVFGFYWLDAVDVQKYKAYTEDTKNGGVARALTYQLLNNTSVTTILEGTDTTTDTMKGGDDWIIAFEDHPDGDYDYNDAVFLIKDVSPVPEPGTMMLLGAGFLGLAIYGKRRKNA